MASLDVFPRSLRAAAALLAALMLTTVLGGCTTIDWNTLDTRPAEPRLPPPLEATRSERVAVHFDPAFGVAAPLVSLQGRLHERHLIGAPLLRAMQQVLQARFESVVELTQAPAPDAAPPPGIDALLRFGVPEFTRVEDPKASLARIRHRLHVPLETRHADGRRSVAALEAQIAISGPFAAVLDRSAADAELVRNAAAMLSARLRLPPWGDAAHVGQPVAAASPGATVTLRLDADQARGDALEREITECVAAVAPPPSTLQGSGDAPAAALRDALFPWLEPGVVPLQAEALAAMLARPAVRERLLGLGIGRLLLLTTTDAVRVDVDQLGCLGGFAAAVCIGRLEQTERYALGATLWEVASASPLGSREAAVSRTTGAVGVLLPIPYVTSNRAETCEQLRALVRGGG